MKKQLPKLPNNRLATWRLIAWRIGALGSLGNLGIARKIAGSDSEFRCIFLYIYKLFLYVYINELPKLPKSWINRLRNKAFSLGNRALHLLPKPPKNASHF